MNSSIIIKNGKSFIKIGDELYTPAMFRSFRPTPANISLFKRNGIKLYQMLVSGLNTGMDTPYSLFGPVWIDKGEYDFAAFDRQIEMFKKFAPDSYYMIFLQLDTPYKWLNRHTNHESSFEHLECGMFDEEWQRDASEYISDFIDYAEEKYGDCIFGYAFCAGTSCEWFARPNEKADLPQFSKPFGEYCQKNDIEFSDYLTTWDDIWKNTDKPFFERKKAEGHLSAFGAEHIQNLVLKFASVFQKKLNHKKVLGTFFGYHCLNSSVNMAYLNDKVYTSPDIDMIFSPAEYDEFRQIENQSGFQLAVNSLNLNNKLYIHEIDHRTELAKYPMEHAISGCSKQYRMVGGMLNDCYETEYEGVMVLRRELALAMQNGSAFWWFDFFGNYYASPAYEEYLSQSVKILDKIYRSPEKCESIAQIAFIVDNNNFKYIHEGNNLKWNLIRYNHLNIGKAGLLHDIYNIEDIEKIDFSKYKMVIFSDLFEISESNRAFINEKLQDKLKIWLFAPNYFNCDGSQSIESMSDVTGMTFEKFSTDKSEMIETSVGEFGFTNYISELFAVTGDVEILGTYKHCGKIAMAKSDNNIYCGMGNISPEVWRMLAKIANVHLFTDGRGVIIANSEFVAYENAETTECVLSFDKDYTFEELFDGGEYKTENKVLRYDTEKGRTKLFMIKNS